MLKNNNILFYYMDSYLKIKGGSKLDDKIDAIQSKLNEIQSQLNDLREKEARMSKLVDEPVPEPVVEIIKMFFDIDVNDDDNYGTLH